MKTMINEIRFLSKAMSAWHGWFAKTGPCIPRFLTSPSFECNSVHGRSNYTDIYVYRSCDGCILRSLWRLWCPLEPINYRLTSFSSWFTRSFRPFLQLKFFHLESNTLFLLSDALPRIPLQVLHTPQSTALVTHYSVEPRRPSVTTVYGEIVASRLFSMSTRTKPRFRESIQTVFLNPIHWQICLVSPAVPRYSH